MSWLFLLCASSRSLCSPFLWPLVRSGTKVMCSYWVNRSTLAVSRRCLFSSSLKSPITIGLGSFPRSPILLQNLRLSFLVLARMVIKILSHCSLSFSDLSLFPLISSSTSGTPCMTRFSLLTSLSLSSSSIVCSILPTRVSAMLACSLTSLLASSAIFLTPSINLLFSSTLLSVSSCLLETSFICAFHLLLKFMHDLQAQ